MHMSVFKYVTAEGALRFLDTWALRITPPDQFNDPFEMKPPVDVPDEVVSGALSPAALRDDISRSLMAEMLAHRIPVDQCNPYLPKLVSLMLDDMSTEDEQVLLRELAGWEGPEFLAGLINVAPLFRREMKQILSSDLLPAINASVQKEVHGFFTRHVGSLCMTRCGCHPLMWAHYADEHRGAVIEFDEEAACFNRPGATDDGFGRFAEVVYSDVRPRLFHDAGEDAFKTLLLTKAIEWKYEEEVRLLWPLQQADRRVNDSVHLLSVPTTAVRSITLGCRASDALIDEVVNRLKQSADANHIMVRRAMLDSVLFALNYLPV